ncbi:peptidyl-prolyl cis-trans isomerase [Mariniblastus sp.]|nr:peptidyl-prolyl cis-trans isomerase [Mariniblastus sp.]
MPRSTTYFEKSISELNGTVMRLSLLLSIGLVVATVGCTSPETPTFNKADAPAVLDSGEPNAITVQHCLIGFKGSVGRKPIQRTQEEAAKLAAELLEKLNAGEDFGKIIKTYTDDSPPGIYEMVNSGLPTERGVHSRDKMVPAFGNVGFKLDVGEYGMSEYDPAASPYGWHIIKRLK